MGKPPLTVKEWCNREQKSKQEFLEQESQRLNGLVARKGNSYISRDEIGYLPMETVQLSNGCILHVHDKDFKQLKKLYLNMKSQQKNNGSTKKQYQLKSETIQKIKKLQEDHSWSKEEAVIDHILQLYIDEHAAQKFKDQLENRPMKLKILKQEIDQHLDQIQKLMKMNGYLKKQYQQNLKVLAKLEQTNQRYQKVLQEHKIDIPHLTLDDAFLEVRVEEINENLTAIAGLDQTNQSHQEFFQEQKNDIPPNLTLDDAVMKLQVAGIQENLKWLTNDPNF